ncbi:hypothetical protein [Variovorax sp. Sphag1AA]|uniref:hypothetical protein n=1 Tax=Variovorax sp. Sphag1AA TaxID=2587027 RepID=UPI0016134F82|nr:hypothetical protein [Variovorax sp. Sphag1AA]MBB3180799.1 hypothetical protein [Variovorax sp. Sphag1AA]
MEFTAGMNVKIEHEVVPGRYIAELEDGSGTYFFGEGRAIRDMNEWLYPQSRWLEGGIFLPKDHTQPPRFFYVFIVATARRSSAGVWHGSRSQQRMVGVEAESVAGEHGADLPPAAVPFITRKSGVARLIDLCGD